MPTFLFNVDGVPADEAARRLGERGVGVWYADNWYCVALGRACRSLVARGARPLQHRAEVDRLLEELAAL